MEHVQKLGTNIVLYIYIYITVCDAATSARAATECCIVLRILEDSRVERAVKAFRERVSVLRGKSLFNLLNTELNPICHLLALLGAHPVFQISRIRVKQKFGSQIQQQTLDCAFHVSGNS
jgi:hypothetical protein